MKKRLLTTAASLIALSVSQVARGDTLAVDFTAINPDPTDTGISGYIRADGYEFSPNVAITVDGLAAWDQSAAGFAPGGTREVALWDSSGDLLASAFVTPTSPLAGSAPWRWTSIAPIALTAGQDYYVTSQGSDAYVTSLTVGLTVDPLITFIKDAQWETGAPTAGLEPPPYESGSYTAAMGGGSFGGNIMIEDMPEPVSLAVISVGIVGLGLVRRRRG
jgi:hypothetical protein